MVDKKIEEVMAELMLRMTETEKLQFLSYCEGMIAKAQMQRETARDCTRTGHAASVRLLCRQRLCRGYAASVALVPRERLRYHGAEVNEGGCMRLPRRGAPRNDKDLAQAN